MPDARGAARRRVVVTGIGAVTPLGFDWKSTWSGIMAGTNPCAQIRCFPSDLYPTRIAYEVPGASQEAGFISASDRPYLNRAGMFGVYAAREALERAGLWKTPLPYEADRVAVNLGVGIGCPDFEWMGRVYFGAQFSDPSVKYHDKYFPSSLSKIVGRMIDARGALCSVHTACASSGQAVGEAFESVAFGEADLVVAGGADAMVSPFHVMGFSLLGTLSQRNDTPHEAMRPFDADRDGFVLGEGACLMILEERERAIARGAHPLAEIVGYGVTESAYRITDLHPEGQGPVEAMAQALDDADLKPSDVRYINAHGTSTKINDQVEALSIRKVFGEPDAGPWVSSTKSMTGHLISGAGALELGICMGVVTNHRLPPSLNVQKQDPECPVRLTPAQTVPSPVRYALSNSVGFGGSNTALIVKGLDQ